MTEVSRTKVVAEDVVAEAADLSSNSGMIAVRAAIVVTEMTRGIGANPIALLVPQPIKMTSKVAPPPTETLRIVTIRTAPKAAEAEGAAVVAVDAAAHKKAADEDQIVAAVGHVMMAEVMVETTVETTVETMAAALDVLAVAVAVADAMPRARETIAKTIKIAVLNRVVVVEGRKNPRSNANPQ